jgi:hypothetical protein
MKLASGRFGFAAAALVLGLALAVPAWAGGNDDGPDEHPEDAGPRYFGFVKDTGGKMIPDAKVTADVKGRGTVVARSDAVGMYKIPGFGKQVPPNNVTISCSKDGFKQTRVLRRTPPSKNPVTAIETECTMQRVGAK